MSNTGGNIGNFISVAKNFLSNPVVLSIGVVTAVVILFIIGITYLRRRFNFNVVPGLSNSDATDPSAILNQITILQDSVAKASTLNDVIKDITKLRTNLSGMTANSIIAAMQTVNSAIQKVEAVISDNATSLDEDTTENLTEMVNALLPQVSNDLIQPLNNLLSDLQSNASPTKILADLNELATELAGSHSSEGSLVSSIGVILSDIDSGVKLSDEERQKIQAVLTQVSTVTSASSNISNSIAAIKSTADSSTASTQTLVTNLNNLQSTVQTFTSNNLQQLSNLNTQIGTALTALNDQSTGASTTSSAIKSSVASILTSVSGLTTTTNAIQTLANTIQQQMGTGASTGSLVTNLTTLQSAVTQLSNTQTSQYNTLASSITSVTNSLAQVNTIDTATQTAINSIISTVQSINTSNSTISSNVTSITNALGNASTAGTVVNTVGSVLSQLTALQTSVSNSATANSSSFTSLTNSITAISNSLASGVTLAGTGGNSLVTTLNSIQSAVAKNYTKNSFIIAVAQLKQSMPDVQTFNKFGLSQLQTMDSGNSSLGLTRQFDEYTSGSNIGAAVGRIYTDTSKTPTAYYHIDGTGYINNVTLGVPYTYNNIADGTKHTMIIASNTVVFDSTDPNGVTFTQINLTNGNLGTAKGYNLPSSGGFFGTPSPSNASILMNTATVTAGTTKYLSVSGNNYFLSTDGTNFNAIDPVTGATLQTPAPVSVGGKFYNTPYVNNGVTTGVFSDGAGNFIYKSPYTGNLYKSVATEGGMPIIYSQINTNGSVIKADVMYMIGPDLFEFPSTKPGHLPWIQGPNSWYWGNLMNTPTLTPTTKFAFGWPDVNYIWPSAIGGNNPWGYSTDGIKFNAVYGGNKASGTIDTTKFAYITNGQVYIPAEPINSTTMKMTTATVTPGTTLYGGYVGTQFYTSTDGISFTPWDTDKNLPVSTTKVFIIGNTVYSTPHPTIPGVFMNGTSVANSAGLVYYSAIRNKYFYAAITSGTPGNWVEATASSLTGAAFQSSNTLNSVCLGTLGFTETPSTLGTHTGLTGPSGPVTVMSNGTTDATKDVYGFWLNATDYYVSNDGVSFAKVNTFATSPNTAWNASLSGNPVTGVTTGTAYIIQNTIFYNPNDADVYRNSTNNKYLSVQSGVYYVSNDGQDYDIYDPNTNAVTVVNLQSIPGYGPIANLVGNSAPGVYMSAATLADSSAFLYQSRSGAYYLSTDSADANNGGNFFQITNTSTNPVTLSSTRNTSILYTDLANGGFFEVPSTNPNHTSAMQIFMNTANIQSGVTQYLAQANAANNLGDWGYSQDGIRFFGVTRTWAIQNASFQYDTQRLTYIVAGIPFKAAWKPNASDANLLMNTSTITLTSKYLYMKTVSGTTSYFISNDGIIFNPVNIATGAIDTHPANAIVYVSGAGEMSYQVSSDPSGNYNAPGVFMNQTTFSASTAFIYASRAGKYYLSTDGADANNGGHFFEMINIPAGTSGLSASRNTTIVYTDLTRGGFFEYPSTNANHTSSMNILMNTPTLQAGVTQYACAVFARTSFPGFVYSTDGITFSYIATTWIYQNQGISFNTSIVSYTVSGQIFRSDWAFTGISIRTPYSAGAQPNILMNTASFTAGTTNLIWYATAENFNGDNRWYISLNSFAPSTFLWTPINTQTGNISTSITLAMITAQGNIAVFNAFNSGTGTLASGSYQYQMGIYGRNGNPNAQEQLQITNGIWRYSLNAGTTWIDYFQ